MARYLPVYAGLAILFSGFGVQAADFPSTRAAQPPPCDRLDPSCQVVPPPLPASHRLAWPEIWGYAGTQGFFTGERMAPNGVAFDTIFALESSLNLGLMPNQRLYLFTDMKFWMQKAGPGITNADQGKWDFSKREFDYFVGLALNYWGPLEFRTSFYSYANLNRGNSLVSPFGFRDGVLLENRWYFHAPDRYDIGRSSYISVGYYPTKGMAGGDGVEFKPAFLARVYGAYDLPFWHSYLYLDAQVINEKDSMKVRHIEVDGGLAVRPLDRVQNVEFRVGGNVVHDPVPDTTRYLAYGAGRFVY